MGDDDDAAPPQDGTTGDDAPELSAAEAAPDDAPRGAPPWARSGTPPPIAPAGFGGGAGAPPGYGPPAVPSAMPGGAGRGAGRDRPGMASPMPGPAGGPPGAPGWSPSTPPQPRQPTPSTVRGSGRSVAPPGSSSWGPPGAVPGVVAGAYAPNMAVPTTKAERTQRQYPASATSPLWWLLGWLAGVVASIVAGIWALASIDWEWETDTIEASGGRFWVFFVVALATYVVFAIWLSIIGTNSGEYGLMLVVAGTFPWWSIFLLLGPFGAIIGAVCVLIVYFWPWRKVIAGVWCAARLPSAYSWVGWGLYPIGVILAITPIDVLNVIGNVLVSIQSLLALGLMIAATVVQHLGIWEDRRRTRSAPLPMPG